MQIERTTREVERTLYKKALRKYQDRVINDPKSADGFPLSQEFRDYRLAVRDATNGKTFEQTEGAGQ